MKSFPLSILFALILLWSCNSSTETKEATTNEENTVVENNPEAGNITEEGSVEDTETTTENDNAVADNDEMPSSTKEEKSTPDQDEETIEEENATNDEEAIKSPPRPDDVHEEKEDPLGMPDHQLWDAMLEKYVNSKGNVNYAGWKADKSKLNEYLEHLATTSPQSHWSRNEKLAYWINLYNAATVKLILDHYPVTSIMKINDGKPWDKRFVQSGNKTYTLSEVENDVIRKFGDPRIHFAVNCASISCPKLMNNAYSADKLNSQLTSQTKYFINKSGKNEISSSKLALSKIFEWYAIDFKKAGGVVSFIQKYADTDVKDNAKVTFMEYNWDLNK